MRIDDKTVVPLVWLIAGFSIGLAPVATAVYWVSTVNFRLTRIEEKLGIPAYHSSTDSADAYAGEKPNADGNRLRKPLSVVQSNH